MANSFRKLSWGLLLVLLDIRIAYFDVWPDVIGYGMMYFALQRLGAVRPAYGKAAGWAAAMAVVSLAEIWPGPFGFHADAPPSPGWIAFGGMLLLLKLLFMHQTFAAMERHAFDGALPAEAHVLRFRRRLYTGGQWLMLLALPFALNAPDESRMFAFVAVIPMFLLELMAVFTFRRAAHWQGRLSS
ncbi:hypothetical protein [Paenibacillus validus]|uniref:hypothetical protein n=1 Tax=Paenibacillus validus TaxID=44253 RepID=UPI003D2CD2C7